MNKKALLAICIAVLIPLVCYIILKSESDNAVIMPNHYLPDSVVTNVSEGKMKTDTLWHKVADIRLQNQLGDTVNLYDIKGKAIVADFFFTSCAYVCPRLTQNMAKLQQSFMRGGDPMNQIDTSVVQFVSFTIDPERDSVAKLKIYADKFGVNYDNWWMLTGSRDSIYNYIFQELKVDKYETDGPLDSNFAHTQKFVLIDKDHNVRGYYNGLDSSAITKLAKDIGLLMLESNPNNPEPLPFDPTQMAIFFAITFVIVITVTSILARNKRKEEKKIIIMLQAAFQKNDKKAKQLIWVFSAVVFSAVVLLSNFKLNIQLGFNVHVFAFFNAIINAAIAVLLVAALVAVKQNNYLLHKRIMLTALLFSVLFLISYIAHHLLAGEAKFGDIDHDGILSNAELQKVSGIRTVYLIILSTHIFLAAVILPFILFTAYRALIGEYAQHKKLARYTWPLWFYVAVTGPIIYWMISPYYY